MAAGIVDIFAHSLTFALAGISADLRMQCHAGDGWGGRGLLYTSRVYHSGRSYIVRGAGKK